MVNINGRRYVIYSTILIMEGSWLYAALALMNRKAAEGVLSVWGLLLGYLIAFASTKVLQRLGWHRFFLTCISWILWAGVMLLTVKIQLFSHIALFDTSWLLAFPQALAGIFYGFKPELLVLFSSGIVWWLGRRLAYRGTDFSVAVGEFQFGLVMLLLIFFSATEFGLAGADSVPTALIFFSSALLGMSIAHANESKSWLSEWYNGNWAGLLVVSIGLILVCGFIISIIVTPDLLQLIIAGLKWLWQMFERFMEFLASLFPQQPGPMEPLPMPAVPGGETPEQYKIFEIPEELRNGFRLAWTIVVSGFILLAIWRVSTQIFAWMRRRVSSPGGEVESLRGALKADIIGWLKGILMKILNIKKRLLPVKPNIPAEAATVRQIYAHLLQWAAAGGYPRGLSQTPDEYLPVLNGIVPGASNDFDFITRQYVSARYGSYLPDDEELGQLKQSLSKIKQNKELGS